MAVQPLQIQGLRELIRAFNGMSKDLGKEITKAVQKAAEPAAQEAESLALGRIRNMPRSPHWAGMRIGVGRARGEVYMVPRARSRRRTARPNLKGLLLDRAMEPAVEMKAADIAEAMGDLVDHIADAHGFD